MKLQARKNFHLPLPNELYESLTLAAKEEGKPATDIARAALDHFLRSREKRIMDEKLTEFVKKNAGTIFDLDPVLEAAGLETLRPEK